MRTRAFTLLELIVALGMTALIAAASAGAVARIFSVQQAMTDSTQQVQNRRDFEDTITKLLRRTYIDATASGTNTFFIGSQGNQTPGQPMSKSVSQSQGGLTSPGSGGDSTSLSFTVIDRTSPVGELNSQADFATLNQNYGPHGGASEIQIGTQPVGSPPGDSQGVFLRVQTPSDSDPTQGGTERLLESGVQDLTFEFFDGTQWEPTWNTQSMTTPRLPSEIQVTYRLQSDQTERIFVVRIPSSDVTPTNPVTTGAQ